jgi:hypothetical protein
MATYLEPSEEIQNLFDKVREASTIPHWIEFGLKVNNKMKSTDGYKITKVNDLMGSFIDGLNFAIVINEDIFGKLPVDLQEIAFAECIAGVSVSDTDAVGLEKPNFTTHTGVLQKFGHEKVIQLKESIKSLYDAVAQAEDEAKAQKKAKRAEKAAKKAGK